MPIIEGAAGIEIIKDEAGSLRVCDVSGTPRLLE